MGHEAQSTIPLYFQGQWIDVTEDVYSAYYQEWERVKYLRKKDRKHCPYSYEALCEEDNMGEDIAVGTAPEIEEEIIKKEQYELLHKCLDSLPSWESKLITALFFEGKTEREYAEEINVSKSTVNDRKKKILAKLKSYMEYLE